MRPAANADSGGLEVKADDEKPVDRGGPALRSCLKCGWRFHSEHKFNRICRHCGGHGERVKDEESSEPPTVYWDDEDDRDPSIDELVAAEQED